MSSGLFEARPRTFVQPSVPMTSSLRGSCHDSAGGAAGYGLRQTACRRSPRAPPRSLAAANPPKVGYSLQVPDDDTWLHAGRSVTQRLGVKKDVCNADDEGENDRGLMANGHQSLIAQ